MGTIMLRVTRGDDYQRELEFISDQYRNGNKRVRCIVDTIARLISNDRLNGSNVFRSVDKDDDHYLAEDFLAEYSMNHQPKGHTMLFPQRNATEIYRVYRNQEAERAA